MERLASRSAEYRAIVSVDTTQHLRQANQDALLMSIDSVWLRGAEPSPHLVFKLCLDHLKAVPEEGFSTCYEACLHSDHSRSLSIADPKLSDHRTDM